MSISYAWSIINIVLLTAVVSMIGLSIYALILYIKALKNYINKNS